MPRVLVLTSGHEVIEPGESLTPGKIYNSNRAMICGLLEDLGFHKIIHYHVSDAPEELDSEINHVLKLSEEADVIISSGGVSVGLFDTMPLIYEKLGQNLSMPVFKCDRVQHPMVRLPRKVRLSLACPVIQGLLLMDGI